MTRITTGTTIRSRVFLYYGIPKPRVYATALPCLFPRRGNSCVEKLTAMTRDVPGKFSGRLGTPYVIIGHAGSLTHVLWQLFHVHVFFGVSSPFSSPLL